MLILKHSLLFVLYYCPQNSTDIFLQLNIIGSGTHLSQEFCVCGVWCGVCGVVWCGVCVCVYVGQGRCEIS
jgi:hypothetical protein